MPRGKANESNNESQLGSQLNNTKKKKRNSQGDESQSQVHNTQTQRALENMDTAEFNRKVADMVRYLLFADRKKVGMKRADLVKNVLKDHARTFKMVFLEATKQISDIFGYEVAMMENDEGKSKGYILTNGIISHNKQNENLMEWDENQKMGLLMIIVSILFMNENTLTEASLWHTLQKFGIKKERKHNTFGDVEKLINQEFVKENYLDRIKVQGPEGQTFTYQSGTRTKKEISKRSILEFVSEIYGTESIESWKIHYQEVLDSEKQPDVEMIEEY